MIAVRRMSVQQVQRSNRFRDWFTDRRLQAQALLLLAALWGTFAWDYATPGLLDRAQQIKGADFLHFYTIGNLARHHRGDELYDIAAQQELTRQIVPDAGTMRYLPLYPPQVSMFFAPLSSFSYGSALFLWSLISLTVYAVSCWAIWRVCPALSGSKLSVALCVLAYPAFWHLIVWGQTSAPALGCFVLAYLALSSHQKFLAGLALGCLIYKPQLGLAAAVVLLLSGEWPVLGGAVLAAGVQLIAAWLYFGSAPLNNWYYAIAHVFAQSGLLEPRTYQTHCLRTFWAMLLPWPGVSKMVYELTVVFVALATVKIWRSKIALPLRFSALLLATVLVSPHLTVYDLVILAPALLLLANHAAETDDRRLGHLIYLTYILPLFGILAMWTHVQLSVIAMFVALMWIAAYRPAVKSFAVGLD